MRTTSTFSRFAALIAGAALTTVVTACGGGSAATDAAAPGAPPTSTVDVAAEHNDADVRFAQMMILHHRQAVDMAAVAVDRAERQEIVDLAEQIRAAQDPEIATMTAFLQAWGAEVPAAGGGTAGMDNSGTGGMSGMASGDTAGMMTPEQMDQLEAASGATFDTMFLQMMIAHHEGAVADAKTEFAEGSNPQAKELAQKIVDGQSAEIAQMQGLQAA
jgi:uncharacterized protein (DUF305 family)